MYFFEFFDSFFVGKKSLALWAVRSTVVIVRRLFELTVYRADDGNLFPVLRVLY